MSEDAPIEAELVEEPLVVKLPPVVMKGMALTTLIEHGMRQSKIIQGMLAQAAMALERARAASNDGPGGVLKMIVPIMIHRKQYLSQEIQMWGLVMEAAECDLEDIRPELDEIDRVRKTKEDLDGGREEQLFDVEPCDCGRPCEECDGAHDPDEIPG